jgi:hypothetical protein
MGHRVSYNKATTSRNKNSGRIKKKISLGAQTIEEKKKR